MNFKRFNDIGNSEPRASGFNRRSSSISTRFDAEEEEVDEIPVPYCDEFEEDEEDDTEEEEENEENETETETESITSIDSKKNPLKRNNKKTVVQVCTIVLKEEFDFMPE